MAEWFSIEVFDGAHPARSWADAYGDALIGAAMSEGGTDWEWHSHRWGVVLELELPDEAAWERFQALPSVVAALDAVPDPVNGVILYRGRGGSSASPAPRRPRPLAGSGAASLPLPPLDDLELDVFEAARWLGTAEKVPAPTGSA